MPSENCQFLSVAFLLRGVRFGPTKYIFFILYRISSEHTHPYDQHQIIFSNNFKYNEINVEIPAQ